MEQMYSLIHMIVYLESNNIRLFKDIWTFSDVNSKRFIDSKNYDFSLPKLLALCKVRSLMNREPIISQCRINLEAVSWNDLSWSFNGYNNVNIAFKLLNYEYKNWLLITFENFIVHVYLGFF